MTGPANQARGGGKVNGRRSSASAGRAAALSRRFVVVETEGWAIKPQNSGAPGGRQQPLLSCSVIDTVWPTRPEVARFSMENVRGFGRGHVTCEQAREQIRNRAAGVAAILEAQA